MELWALNEQAEARFAAKEAEEKLFTVYKPEEDVNAASAEGNEEADKDCEGVEHLGDLKLTLIELKEGESNEDRELEISLFFGDTFIRFAAVEVNHPERQVETKWERNWQ